MGGSAATARFLALLILFASASASASALSLSRSGGGDARKVVVSGIQRAVGPGSTPPTCRSKCGKCSPCKPVHVPIHPGTTQPLEYYPEAWRCKCGNKLFMP